MRSSDIACRTALWPATVPVTIVASAFETLGAWPLFAALSKPTVVNATSMTVTHSALAGRTVLWVGDFELSSATVGLFRNNSKIGR